MPVKKTERKRIKMDARKLGRIICFAFLTIALLIGIIFSSVKVNMNMVYGPEYNGAYQASVQVIEKTDKAKQETLNDLAKSLSDKLAPFSDKSITVTKEGKNHLNVIVGKQDYENNETYLTNQIESNGGLFMLSGNAKDGYQDYYLTAKDANGKRHTSADFFNGDVTTKTLSNGAGRDPFVRIGLTKGTKAKYALQDTLNAEQQQNKNAVVPGQGNVINKAMQLDSTPSAPQYANLTFVTDLEQMIDTLRYLYVVNSNSDTIDTYFNDIIQPIQKRYAKLHSSTVQSDLDQATVLRNLFSGTVNWFPIGSRVPQQTKISLLDTNFSNAGDTPLVGNGILVDQSGKVYVSGINTEEDLENILPLFTPNTGEQPTSNFVYSPDATIDDTKAKFTDWFGNSTSITKADSFKYTVNAFLNNDVLFNVPTGTKQNPITPSINPDFLSIAPQLGNDVLYTGGVSASTKADGVDTSVSGEVGRNISFIVDNSKQLKQDTTSMKDGFYLRTKNLTSAKKAVASIKQNALGVGYLVESIVEVNPYITSVLYITSVVFLSIVALLLAIYVLFVYRLLGLFTLIIAACSVAITLLAAAGFGIGMGPQVICALFIIIALILDSNFILFEGWKKNYYEEKHGIISSFKIGNKSSLAMAVDAVLVAFIPNIVLFWAATGPLKTFGTLTIIGVGLAVVAGIIIGRFVYWLILKNKMVQKTDWLLPMDTRYTTFETMKDEFAINKYTSYLENHEGKTHYTTNELAKINEAKEKLKAAQASYNKNIIVANEKVAARDEKTLKWITKNTAFLEKIKSFLIKAFRISKPEQNGMIRIIDGKLEDNRNILNIENDTKVADTGNKSKLKDKGKIVRADRMVGRGMTILSIVLVVIGVVAAIVGGIKSVSWSTGIGYGQQFVVYGTQLEDSYTHIGSSQFNLNNKEITDKWTAIQKEYSSQASQSNNVDLTYAYEIRDLLQFVNDKNLFSDLGQKGTTKKINLKGAKFEVITNYHHVASTDKLTGKDLVALQISSTSKNKASRSAFKRLLVDMATGEWPNSDSIKDGAYNSDQGGIYAYDIEPYTVSKQIRNVGIAFGIALAILVAYILIRFKWTYYVALALGLGLVIGTVVSLIVICRVPMSTEMLCGMVFVITFALTSMVLVLGKGKSELNLSSKENIKKNFSESIKLEAEVRAKKAETRILWVPKRKKLNSLWRRIVKLKMKKFFNRGTFDQFEELHDLVSEHGNLKNDYKAIKKEQVSIYKNFKDEAKQKENKLQRNNWYFKKLFAALIKYSAWRMATLGVFYLLVGIILAATLPTITGMGVTIVFGVIAGLAIALFMSVPIWVYFEKRRIRFVYGRKQYIESLKVSREEEIVEGIND